MPKVKHPTSGMVINVKAERAEKLIARGYKPVKDKQEKAPAAPEEEQSGGVPEEAGAGEEASVSLPERPSTWARKSTWVAYAEAVGADVSQSMSKAEIIDAADAADQVEAQAND